MKKTRDEAGMILCTHCEQPIHGAAMISYTIEGDFVEDDIIIHESCIKPYRLKKKGLTHKCPKCNGRGLISSNTLNLWTKDDGTVELVWTSELYRKSSRYNSGKMEVIKERTFSCILCDGEGFLEKEPIPVITDWRKAT